MIDVDLPAAMVCEEKNCGARLGIKLALTLAGTFAARPPTGHGWQIGVSEQGVIQTRCPQHHSKIEHPPGASIGDLVAARNAKH